VTVIPMPIITATMTIVTMATTRIAATPMTATIGKGIAEASEA
jgi:hypothetical protein